MDFTFMKGLKDFLSDRPEYAFLAFSLFAVVILWRAYRKAEDEKLAITLRVIPLADKLTKILQRITERRTVKKENSAGDEITKHDPDS